MGADLAPVVRGAEHPRDRLGSTERRVLEALLRRKPLLSEEVAARAGVPAREAMRVLPALVADGFACRRAHGFVLAPAPGGRRSPAGGAAA
jgi:predicted ArsR family transcriptional regulator